MNQITVLYDAFGKPSTLKRGWGYSALVEYGGKRVLFDTGDDGADFAYNVRTLGVDLTRLDLVVLSESPRGSYEWPAPCPERESRRKDLHTGRHGRVRDPTPPALMSSLIRARADQPPEDTRLFRRKSTGKARAGNALAGCRFCTNPPAHRSSPGLVLVLNTIRCSRVQGNERDFHGDPDAAGSGADCRLFPCRH